MGSRTRHFHRRETRHLTLDRRTFPVVHAVTDSATVTHDHFAARAEAVMRAMGPRGALHLRSSRVSGRDFYELAQALVRVQDETGCWLIVNDRADIAAAVGARGLQLASHSLRIAEALAVLPGGLIGASIHSVEEAEEAERAGASWCVAGTVFETPSHVGRPPARLDFVTRVAAAVQIPIIAIGGVTRVAAAVQIPIIAIGGVTPDDVAPLVVSGAHGVATIRGAGWDSNPELSPPADDMLKTRLMPETGHDFVEPVTRYISSYDSVSGSKRDDDSDCKRSTPGTGA